MSILSADDRNFAETLSRIVYTNPFLPERIELERQALGDAFDPSPPVWSMRVDRLDEEPNLVRLGQRAVAVAQSAREAMQDGKEPTAEDLQLYEDIAAYALYHTYRNRIYELIVKHAREDAAAGPIAVPFWPDFRSDVAQSFQLPGRTFEIGEDPAHLLALFFQIRRAFHHIFYYVVGGSLPAARLRGQIWQSVFTHNLRRYRRALYRSIGDVTTLITGPSGTGKELVARAIALSRYIPFDESAKAFPCNLAGVFLPLNLSALSPTLIESELFGHRRGAFTGATTDHKGWLEVCSELGTVFLDEIGDLDGAIQVKLLRVLQSRTFQRLGDTHPQCFRGKIVAATNRDLATDMQAGRFRPDLYYRLCADTIVTPPLAEQLADAPEDLPHLVRYVAQSVGGDAADDLAAEVIAWIEGHLGRDYAWPGNFRELEQCVRNVMIRGEYRAVGGRHGADGADAIGRVLSQIRSGQLTAEELLTAYITLVYAQDENYQAAARRLGMDRRTVKSRIDERLLGDLQR
jgi:transcriptional regulator with AAA-type ATPase domain